MRVEEKNRVGFSMVHYNSHKLPDPRAVLHKIIIMIFFLPGMGTASLVQIALGAFKHHSSRLPRSNYTPARSE